MFTVPATETYGICPAPTSWMSFSSFARSTLPLKGCWLARVVRFGNDDVHERSAGQFLVEARGGEIHVAGNVVARLDHDLREDMLGAAALVGGDQVAVAIVVG